jgi:hypothetical protein
MIKAKQTFNIRETAETLVPDKLGRTSYFVALMMILIMLVIITMLLGNLPAIVPMFFTLPWGESRLAPKMMLYMLPLIALVFLTLNLTLGRLSLKLSSLLPRVLAVSTAVVTLMLLVSLLGIVQSLVL